MNPRRGFIIGLAATALILMLSASTVSAVDTAMCEQAGRDLPNNPDIKAFKDCAYSTLTPRCCRKLLPFAKYYDCLDVPTYRDQVNNFLKDTKKTIDNVMDECAG
ncbi:hypothetical protein Vretimale_5567 [Volvox reticuliferus]|uniref:Bifunctional inhibitor/plant lipid transfer protein/seed storage helical domain-containing protein n=1 Tax=Volvox reticuliferus TaxID=1737510 RepID=A0A8J4C6V4_9CHLO|nr:hypothetical protein Vretifemale_5587 [Volvox reticuliferus]GIM00575.1 hypothetical protein Vretimale_5567 [Volvox reticuliferus]